ncbi:histone-lysine N-methyltransferase, H3 lysine-79 specific [Sergentomyia squamirostris]
MNTEESRPIAARLSILLNTYLRDNYGQIVSMDIVVSVVCDGSRYLLSLYVCLHQTTAASVSSVSVGMEKKLADTKISYIRSSPVTHSNLQLPEGRRLTQSKESTKFSSREIDVDKKKLSNPEIFSQLGLAKMKMSPNHHRKRLAIESRHHGHPDDSNMYIIKLPPNNQYYGNLKSRTDSMNAVTDDDSKKVSLGFQSNGKPGRIYHWNLPVLKKLLHNNRPRNPNSRHTDDEAELIDIKNIPTWSNPWDNEIIEKQYREDSQHHEKILKKKSPTYYAPSRAKNFQKYFPSNGKPKSFYVIKSQKLIPFKIFKRK